MVWRDLCVSSSGSFLLTIYRMPGRQTPYVLDIIKNWDEHVVGEILQDLYDGFINTYLCEKLWQFKYFETILILKYSCFDFDIHPVHPLQHSKSGMFALVCF